MKVFTKPFIALGLLAALSLATLQVPSAKATATPDCVDGAKRSSFTVTWAAASTVSIKTVGNKPLCADTTLFFSSYTMPDNYNGQPFEGNPTATPQTIFDSTSVVLKKGTTGASTLKIKLPEACKNIQVDLYYAPEIKTVTPAGHGKQYITGKIMTKTQNECTPDQPQQPPEVPTQEAQTPSTPAPQVTAPEQPASLPSTGISDVLGVTAILTAGTYTAVTYLKKRQ